MIPTTVKDRYGRTTEVDALYDKPAELESHGTSGDSMQDWKLKSPAGRAPKSKTVWRWEILWHVGTTIFILLLCYLYHRHQNVGYVDIIDKMEKALDTRQERFAKEMDELKQEHEVDVEALRKDLREETYKHRHQYRKELGKLEVDYQAAVKQHDEDRDTHAQVSTKLQSELDKHAQYKDTHENILKTAAEHIDVTQESLNKCQADVKDLNTKLKGREGAEVAAAMDDLEHKMTDLRTTYSRLQQLEKAELGSTVEAGNLRKKVNELRGGVSDLKKALESVAATNDFAPKTPRGPLREAAKRAGDVLAATAGQPNVNGST